MRANARRRPGAGFVRARSIRAAVTAVMLMLAASSVRANPPGGTPPGKSKGKPPSGSGLPQPTSAGVAGAASAPLQSSIPATTSTGSPTAWIDEANLLPAGSASIAVYAAGWRGAGASEIDMPVIDAAFGLTPRVQIGANVPRIIGNPEVGTAGGLGTTYFTAKIAIVADGEIKVAVAPTVRILGAAVRESLPAGEGPLQWGLPVIVERDRGAGRVFASTGYFADRSWFAGGGIGVQASPRVGVTGSLSRAWTTRDPLAPTTQPINRTEISGAVSYTLVSQIAIFGSVARTIATTDENGAGLTIAAGVSIFAHPPGRP